jgi:hypothetical protein
MAKLISFAGVSRVDGELKFRTAVSPARITQLQKLGDTDVEMRFLNVPMTKSEAAKRLIAINFANDRADVLALLVSVANDDNPFRAKKPRTVTIKVPNKAMVELVGAQVKVGRGPLGKVYPEIKMTPKQAEEIRNEFNAKHKDLV